MESFQKKLDRVRKPRVHMTYDVETNGTQVKRELPFVVGVMGDYAGDRKPLESLEDRKFIEINRDNFNDVLSRRNPELNLRVKNTLQNDDSEIGVKLSFKNMKDFEPEAIVDQVEPLKKLLEIREQLEELERQSYKYPGLENLLEEIMKNPANIQQLIQEFTAQQEESAHE